MDENSDNGETSEGLEIVPDPSITRELFLQWRSPRLGNANPERMNNPVWDWLARSKLSAYQANKRFNGPPALDEGPGWCMNRFGQSETQLPDGRIILIAGEHEDHYDPDFFIYNDVVVRHPNGDIEIFGYPHGIFPPTDFHSATLRKDQIILIGSLGYPWQRRSGETPVMTLDLATLSVASVQLSGTPPGWIHGHRASLCDDGRSILVQGGKVDRGEGESLVENIDDWRLHLDDWRWERLTERRWLCWGVARADGKPNHLWKIEMAQWSLTDGPKEQAEKELLELERDLGARPDLDLMERLFRPPTRFEVIPQEEDESGVIRITVDGVVIRYVAEMGSLQLTIEGDLDHRIVDAITSDLVGKMSALENTTFVLKQL